MMLKVDLSPWSHKVTQIYKNLCQMCNFDNLASQKMGKTANSTLSKWAKWKFSQLLHWYNFNFSRVLKGQFRFWTLLEVFDYLWSNKYFNNVVLNKFLARGKNGCALRKRETSNLVKFLTLSIEYQSLSDQIPKPKSYWCHQ